MIVEQTFTMGKNDFCVRPFSSSAEVSCRGYSKPLQRAITDFGSDVSFGRIPQKLKEHHGITVPVSSARAVTIRHAEAIHEREKLCTEIPEKEGIEVVIAETDGSMIPIVEIKEEADGGEDARKRRDIGWKEARLSLARAKESVSPIFGATLGTVDEAGDQLANCVIRVGSGTNTKIHCVGDGASWIAEQVERIFGMQANYLIDFYHLCDYVSAAGDKCASMDKGFWMEQQKERIKKNHTLEVLKELESQLEPNTVADKDAPVRACYRYIKNRSGQFDYAGALASNLPIGSGEIESGHRYVIQKRLKIPGAWWKIENAESMLALRVLRANNDWDAYWETVWKKKN